MRLKLLGTSAGELYPGIWCRCHHCETARRLGGPNVRQSACALLDSACLIDFPSEIVSQCWKHGVDMSALRTLLITHSHGDHLFPYLLRWRRRPALLSDHPTPEFSAPRFTPLPLLHVYGNRCAIADVRAELGAELAACDLEAHEVSPFQEYQVDGYRVWPVRANHDVEREEVLNYVIEAGGATLFYGLDTDWFLDETCEFLRCFTFDVVLLESTYGLAEGGNHMSFSKVRRARELFAGGGLLNPNARFIATHFSPHHCPPHEETAALLASHGIEAAFDGMLVDANSESGVRLAC